MKTLLQILCLLAILITTIAGAGGGYIVILKNGQRIRCNEPMSIDGKLAIITLVTGQVTSYPLSQVDLIATERYNQLGLGNALTIEELEHATDVPPTPTPRQTLGNYATISGIADEAELSTTGEPEPTPTPGITLQMQPFGNAKVTRAFTEILDKKNLYLYRTSVGTQPDFFFIQAVTDTEREVFHALKTICEAFNMIVTRAPELAPTAVELKMVETSGRAAGTFRISREDAAAVATGETKLEEFYVEHVIF